MPRKKPPVKVRPLTYEPTKAEMEEPIVLRKRDGSVPTPDELAETVVGSGPPIEHEDVSRD